MPDPIYFDSCMFIELLQQTDEKRFDACDDLCIKAQNGTLIIVTSAITITEVNKLPESPSLPEDQSKKILAFFMNPYIAIRPLDRYTAELAHELTRTHGLTNLDAIHVATAINARVSVMYTYDSAKGKRKGLLRASSQDWQSTVADRDATRSWRWHAVSRDDILIHLVTLT